MPATEVRFADNINAPSAGVDEPLGPIEQAPCSGVNEPMGPVGRVPGQLPYKKMQLGDADEAARRRGDYCIDELCQCSFHKCPPKRITTKFEGTSAYRSDYGIKPMAQRSVAEAVPFTIAPEDRTFVSESRSAYGPKPMPERLQPMKAEAPRSLPFEGTTAYRSDFKAASPSCYERPAATSGPEQRIAPEDRDFGTAYRINYKGHLPEVCQVRKMPPYPQAHADPSREHLFWDNKEAQWY